MVFSLLALGLFVSTSDCPDSVPAQGRCEGERRVLWCEEGVSKSFDCPAGTACAWSAAITAFDCVTVTCLKDLDADGDSDPVPETGLCAGDRVLWCDKGEVRELTCLPGVSCGWNPEMEGYDCVPASGGAPDTGTEETTPAAPADASGQLPGGSGVLPVTDDVLSAADTGAKNEVAGGGGCATGTHPGGAGLLLLALVAVRGLKR